MRTPVRFQPVKSDLLLRLLIADLVGEKPVRESVAALRAAIAELEAQLDAGEERRTRSPTGGSTWCW